MQNPIPLSLYIHIPWCIKKCPYCDFNSYAIQNGIPEKAYTKALLSDLKHDLPLMQNRTIKSVFLGGGTPTLFSPKAIEDILTAASSFFDDSNIEITLEANPGTMEHQDFRDYQSAGVTRISLGVQSFQNDKLSILGRIHTIDETNRAIDSIMKANFNSYNLDIMYGLPNQTVQEALFDLTTALTYSPPHLSWYNLTIEPNTVFQQKKPPLPNDDAIAEMESSGKALLKSHGLLQYEVSAYSQIGHACQHNLNYWQFGDYIGIGAGAHGKITDFHNHTITRYWKTRYPKNYLEAEFNYLAGSKIISPPERPIEFMLNALRLNNGISIAYFEERTQLPIVTIASKLKKAESRGLLTVYNQTIIPTPLGRQFLNDLLTLFY